MDQDIEALGSASDRLRDAAKWLIAAAAAVGAALIAGSQLSSIGKLPLCTGSDWAWTQQCLRLPTAVLGASCALSAVALVLFAAVRILLPVGVTLEELKRRWNDPQPRADVAFFRANPQQLGYASPHELAAARERAWNVLLAARGSDDEAPPVGPQTGPGVNAAETAFTELQTTVRAVTGVAQYQVLEARFSRTLRRLLPATVLAASGILVFAWAANPPTAEPARIDLRGARLAGADLRDANLSGADMTGADLSSADLRGAILEGARLKDVVWNATKCPDGTTSEAHAGTCLGHLNK